MLRGALKKEAVSAPAPQVELAKSGRSFLKGLLTNLANPKAIIYLFAYIPTRKVILKAVYVPSAPILKSLPAA